MSEERQAPGFVIAVTGLRAEARIAGRSARVRAVAGGGDGRGLNAADRARSRKAGAP